ncbi:MAG: PIN domain-containing protein [Archaeoglobaceae archaeon]|nr:PIN domain-containing protein [Archaeoglobaceae archaeon]MDW8128652.1 PIN domain-containing protein [Archaeoglobaceae archaeon]
MSLFLDSSFLISLIVETQFTEKAKKLLETHIDEDFYTSITVIEETLYVLRRLLKETKRENISRIKLVLDELDVSVLEELSMSDFLDVYSNYDLLPNDALIAATCKHYGIKKIATFDEDFKRVDFLEVLEL